MLVVAIGEDSDEIKLDCNREDYLEWSAGGKDITVFFGEDGKIEDLDLAPKFEDARRDIHSQLEEQYGEFLEKLRDGIEVDDESFEIPYPYDPEKIRVEPYTFSINEIVSMINDDEIQLNPEFQRHFVWRSPKQKSRLIESVLLRIPLPVFYLSQDKDGLFQVIDGLQRLTVLSQFCNNKFRLKGLEYLKDLEGAKYTQDKNKLSLKFKRRLERTQLSFYVIDPQTPTRVKFEIFKRLNQGGKPLKPQEIRNCMASARVREFVKKLASSEEFKVATCGSVTSVRMADQDLVLRFIAFYLFKHQDEFNVDLTYAGTMSAFLDDALDILNREKRLDLDFIEIQFLNAMKVASHLFSTFAFRKYLPEDLIDTKRKKLINNSLYLTWSVALARFKFEEIQNMHQEGALINVLANKLKSDPKYYDAISKGTTDVANLRRAWESAESICTEVL